MPGSEGGAETERAAGASRAPRLQPALNALVDSVWVVSLPGSADRRDYIKTHFADRGLTRYRFFDATPADAPEVRAAFESGQVQRFPPCFRCGGTDCGKPDCNNVLIAPQVANVLTYRRLWAEIAATPQRALVVEDDVVFEPHAAKGLRWLAALLEKRGQPFTAEVPLLIRLGWARGPAHQPGPPFRLNQSLRMANPCHALTSAYARAMLERMPERIDATSDMLLHDRLPCRNETLTLLPPIASELSWSDGSLPSLIHPKPVRTAHLRDQGREAEAQAHEAAIAAHTGHMTHRRFLIVGHPRTGTGYAATLMRRCGLDIGHEADGADGISSWMFASDAPAPYGRGPVAQSRASLVWDHLLQPVRNPATAVPSIMRDDAHAPPSHAFRRDEIYRATGLDIDTAEGPLERAVLSLVLWCGMIRDMGPDLIFRIEDGAPRVLAFLQERGLGRVPEGPLDPGPVNADKPYQGMVRPKPALAAADWAALPAATRDRLDAYCRLYGYGRPDGL